MNHQKKDRIMIYILFWIFMCIGIGARIWQFGTVPSDINQDEAFAGYEAYSLLHYGMDSHGYRFPVYLTTWGSGMSALNSYLTIPFLAIFGAHTWVIRIPQLLVGCLTLWVVFLIVEKTINSYAALCALFLLSISPWHIMMCRWGLDANLAPGFLLFGLYFFLRGMENSRYFILSGILYGLSLYCYATIWPFVPLMLVLQLGYGFLYKKIRISKELLLAGGILFLLALPLFLFLLVNFGLIEEICLPFMSIPKLLYMRADEFSVSNLYEQMRSLWYIIRLQTDWFPVNATEEFGIFYHCSFPFFVFGLFYYAKELLTGLFKRKYCPHMMILIQLGGAVLLGLSITVNINRVNILFIPMIIITASGVYYLCMLIGRIISLLIKFVQWVMKDRKAYSLKQTISKLKPPALGWSKWLFILPAYCYILPFARFEKYYFNEYQNKIDVYFCKGIEDAVDCAMQYEGTIYVGQGILHPRILFLSKLPVTEYLGTVEYSNYPDAFLETTSFGRFCFEFDATKPVPEGIYILDSSMVLTAYEEMGFTLETFDLFTVAHKE